MLRLVGYCVTMELVTMFTLLVALVEPDETLMASAIRHCRHLVNCCVKPNDRMYLT